MDFGGIKIRTGPDAFQDRTDWTQREIRGSEKGAVAGSWFGAIALTLFVLAGHFIFRQPLFITKNIPNPFLGILGLVCLGLIAKATWETLRLKRFGDPVLELNTAPIPLGGTLEGRINLTSGVDKAPEFTLTLACLHRVTTNNGKNSSTSEKVLWSTEGKATLMLGGILPISMTVPSDQPEANKTNPFDCIVWRLTVRAPFPGQAFLEKYEVPVRGAPSAGVA